MDIILNQQLPLVELNKTYQHYSVVGKENWTTRPKCFTQSSNDKISKCQILLFAVGKMACVIQTTVKGVTAYKS